MKYTLFLSVKVDPAITIDEEDFQKFTKVAPTGNLVKLKQAIVNPSFVVAIVPFKEKPEKKIGGYVDEERQVFVVTREEETIPELEDGFPKIGALEAGKLNG
jgi:hypothetical protein